MRYINKNKLLIKIKINFNNKKTLKLNFIEIYKIKWFNNLFHQKIL